MKEGRFGDGSALRAFGEAGKFRDRRRIAFLTHPGDQQALVESNPAHSDLTATLS